MADPTIFISHKHDDAPMAKRLQQTLIRLLGDHVKIFNTSDARAEGVPAGWKLSETIRQALNDCSLVILLYTRDDADWRWCFYECGVANDPADTTPTKTVVLDFGTTRGSMVFDGDKHLTVIDAAERTADAPEDFRQFVRDLVATDHYLPHEVDRETTPGADELFRAADTLYRELLEVGPAAQARLTQELLDALTSVPVANRKHFQPLFADATKALKWGLEGTSGVRELFIEYWNVRLLHELKSMAARRLVFPPGRVYLEWGALLKVCRTTYASDPGLFRRRDRPVLALVSHEVGRLTGNGHVDSLKFWAQAQMQDADPWFYEDPVRRLAKALHEAAPEGSEPPPLVQRVFVIDRALAEDRVAQLADIANWMAGAHMVASIAFEDQRRKSDLADFSDFGIIGNIAVSRFLALVDEATGQPGDDEQPLTQTDPTSYRSLVEDFDPEQIEAAADAWTRLEENIVWSNDALSTECDAAELLSTLAGGA